MYAVRSIHQVSIILVQADIITQILYGPLKTSNFGLWNDMVLFTHIFITICMTIYDHDILRKKFHTNDTLSAVLLCQLYCIRFIFMINYLMNLECGVWSQHMRFFSSDALDCEWWGMWSDSVCTWVVAPRSGGQFWNKHIFNVYPMVYVRVISCIYCDDDMTQEQ